MFVIELGISNRMLVYVGTYTKPDLAVPENVSGRGEGIYVYRLDEESGGMNFLAKTKTVNPSYLAFHPSRNFLYAVNELSLYESQHSGTVSAFAVDCKSGQLEFLNKCLTHGTDPCYVAVDKIGRWVSVTNYSSGSVCVMPVLPDGRLGEASDFLQHVGKGFDQSRQEGPHTHSISIDKSNRFAFVADLGLDKLMVYRFDQVRGMMEPNEMPWIKMKPGSGPRHMAFHPREKFAYVINELNSTLSVLGYDSRLGKLKELQVVPTVPNNFKGENTCADVHITPSGAFVYGSNRGHDSIVIYKAHSLSGKLTYVDCESTRGRTPRSFAIDSTGRFLIVANQDSDSIVIFRINSRTGKLAQAGQIVQVPSPVCVKFLQNERGQWQRSRHQTRKRGARKNTD